MSRTQDAKQFYYVVRNHFAEVPGLWYSLEPGLYWYKHKWVWVAKGNRAYRLKDLGTSHLINTIESLKKRHPEEKRWPLELELLWRKAKAHARRETISRY